MKGQDLLKGMGYIDDKLVEEALLDERPAAAQEKASAGFWEKLRELFGERASRRWVTAVACLAVVIVAGWGISQGGRMGSMDAAPASAPMLGEQKDASLSAGLEETAAEEAEPADAPETEEDAVSVASNGIEYAGAPAEMPMEPAAEDEEFDAVTEMIENYPGDYSYASYAVPAAGEVGYSQPLQDAMAEYHGEATYRVFVDIFEDGAETPLKGDDPKVAKLLKALSDDCGIVTALEKATGPDGKKTVYPTLHATFEQLRKFPGDAEHGWMLFLYGERVE